MTRSLDDIVIACALTGAIHTPSMSEYLPVTPEEIIDEGIAAAKAGAGIIHIHVRDPETGEPVSDLDLFREVAAGIQAETDAIIQPTTGGGMNMTVEERMKVVPELEPEMASCNMGSINFGLYPMLESVDEFEHDWEPDYLEGTWDHIFPNTFESLKKTFEMFQENGTRPELECYDVGHLYNAKSFVESGELEPPIHLQFVMGIHGGIGADQDQLNHMVQTAEKLFGDDASWSVLGAGRMQYPLGTQAAAMGGNARVGLEDNLYLERGTLAESNADQVEKIKRLTWEISGREPASPDQIREFLRLKGRENVNF
ncbi:3-keto-5-aminohexanoate cleavage protein [Haladaptatus halobius]|uniref:3-keto-5-aminohexanoate cleavage protein n=1 Tax=Haladaptatus halobius TaxID=2884875 RepID=UPI001D0B57AD|nr:3-keto-5-aminohexanoate cleavage protein [Haladaptatus halobius]